MIRNLLKLVLLVLLLAAMPIGSFAGKPVKTNQEIAEAGLSWLAGLMEEEGIRLEDAERDAGQNKLLV